MHSFFVYCLVLAWRNSIAKSLSTFIRRCLLVNTTYYAATIACMFNTLRPRQNGHHFPDDVFKCIFLNQNVLISIKISLKFVPKGPINNIPALVQIMAWRLPGDKPLSEPMMVRLPTHICVTWPQWVNWIYCEKYLLAKFNLLRMHSCILYGNWLCRTHLWNCCSLLSLLHTEYVYAIMWQYCLNSILVIWCALLMSMNCSFKNAKERDYQTFHQRF